MRDTIRLHSSAPDALATDLPPTTWGTASNVYFRNSTTRRVGGDVPTLIGAPPKARTCVYVGPGVNPKPHWLYATNTGIFVHDGQTQFDITPSTGWAGTEDATFTSCVLGGIGYVNASDREPHYWDGTVPSEAVPLPDWGAGWSCLALRAHKNFLFAVGMVNEGPQRIRWSDAAAVGEVPAEWAPDQNNLAGFLDLTPVAAPCVDMVNLRDSALIYKSESIWSLDFIGGNDVFRARQLSAEMGAVGTNAITRGPDDLHLFIGSEGDCWAYDGVRGQSILDGRAQRTFYADFKPDRLRTYASATLSREKLGVLMYPRGESIASNAAILFDYPSGDIGFRELPDVWCAAEGGILGDLPVGRTWEDLNQPWDTVTERWDTRTAEESLDDIMMGHETGFAEMFASTGQDYINGPVRAACTRAGIPVGPPDMRKLFHRLWPVVQGSPGDTLAFRIGAQEYPEGPVTLSTAQSFVIGHTKSVDVFLQGRFLYLEVSSTGGSPWRMGSMDVEFKPAGRF